MREADSDGELTRYTATGMVLEESRHGPQFCLAIADTFPPQGGGPDVVGWDWGAVEHQEAEGVRWGEYTVVGTWDGERLTLTEPPTAPLERRMAPDMQDYFTSLCPEPVCGWRPADATRATGEAFRAAMRVAEESPFFAGAWADHWYRREGGVMNDPSRLVLNVVFTGEFEENERRVREVWGGALCVSSASYTEAELARVAEQVIREIPQVRGSGPNIVANRVEVTVFVGTEEFQRELDARYGPGMVWAPGVARPVD